MRKPSHLIKKFSDEVKLNKDDKNRVLKKLSDQEIAQANDLANAWHPGKWIPEDQTFP
jgi:hypothetical protein